jgi:hypothetical protein
MDKDRKTFVQKLEAGGGYGALGGNGGTKKFFRCVLKQFDLPRIYMHE